MSNSRKLSADYAFKIGSVKGSVNMTADSWKSFAADGPPQVGQDVLVLHNDGWSQRLSKWDATCLVPSLTHWTPFTPPEKEDGFEKWKVGYIKALPRFYWEGMNQIQFYAFVTGMKDAWTEAKRQALEQPCPHCKGKRTSAD